MGGSGSVSGQHAYAAPDIYTAAITVIGSSGQSTAVQRKITVHDAGAYIAGEGWLMSPRGAARHRHRTNAPNEENLTIPKSRAVVREYPIGGVAMATTARFVKAADNTRPFKSHRYDVFGPKIQRMLTLFNRAQVDVWLLLESDPLVLSYCERPMVVPDVKPKLLVDFWAGYAGRDELWISGRNSEAASDIQTALPAFAEWAKSNHFTLRHIRPTDESPGKIYLENWGAIVRDLSANRRYLNPKLVKSVREVLEQPRPIAAICNLLPEEDPVLVRVAAYSLLHSGTALCPDISQVPLGPASLVELR